MQRFRRTDVAAISRIFFCLVPNFPALIPGRDTQPFFLLFMFGLLKIRVSTLVYFLVFLCGAMIDALLISGSSLTIYSFTVWLLFAYMLIFFSPHEMFWLQFSRAVPTLACAIALLSFFVWVSPEFQLLFRARGGEVDWSRSIPLVFPEPAFGAKIFYGAFTALLIGTGKVHWLLIGLQFATLSLTGFATGVLSIFSALLISRRSSLKWLIVFGFVGVGLTWWWTTLYGEFFGASRLAYFLNILFSQGVNGLFDILANDQSLENRLRWLEVGELNSLFGFIQSYKISSLILVLGYLALAVKNKISSEIFLIHFIVLCVFGYADTFLYPALVFALKALPICQVNGSEMALRRVVS